MVFLFLNDYNLSSTESGGAPVSKNYDLNDLPGPPSKPQVTDVTKSSVTLSWQPGTPGNLPTSAYVIEAFRYVQNLLFLYAGIMAICRFVRELRYNGKNVHAYVIWLKMKCYKMLQMNSS